MSGMIRLALTALALSAPGFAAQAQTSQPVSGTISLTPEQREAALEAGATRATDDLLQYGNGDRRVHGEIGVEVGSRGERAAYGTVVTPIGKNGVAAFSYATGQGPRWHRRHSRYGRFQGSSIGAAYSNDAYAPTVAAPGEAESVNPD
jgi:hypothetical protein